MARNNTCKYLLRFPEIVPVHLRKTCRLLSTASTQITQKTVNDLPGQESIFGLGIGRIVTQALRSTNLLTSKKPLGAIMLELQIRRVNEFGPIFKTDIPGLKPRVNLGDPMEMARVLRNEPKYPIRMSVPTLNYYRELRKAIPGVFFANGEDWYRYRSTVSKRILKPREVAEHIPVFNDIITDFILTRLDSIRVPAGTDTEYEVKNLENELFKWVFESVAHVLFDKRFGCLEDRVNPEAQGFIDAVEGFLSALYHIDILPVWLYKIYETKTFKNFVFHLDNMYKYAEIFINEKVKELECKRIAEQCTEADTEEKIDLMEYLVFNRKLTRDDIMGCLIDLMFAAIDTTTNSMQFFLYMMAKNPDKQEKLYQEITLVLQSNGHPSTGTLAKMPYLKACFKETLRLYPILSQTGRIIPTDMDILGYHIPKGTEIIFLHYYMGRSEKYFNNPNDFIPERWLKDKKREIVDATQAFASIPFGFGTRMCAGRRIAELELYLLATRLIQKYKIQYPEGEIVEPFMKSVTTPDRPLRVKFIHRT